MGSFELYTGDCLDVLPTLAAGSVDAVITDPPYGIDYQSSWRIDKDKRKPKIANDLTPCVEWLDDAFRVTKPGGALLCFCRWDVEHQFRCAIEAAGFNLRSQVIWDKVAHGMGDLNGSFAPQHENILFATKGHFKFWKNRPQSIIRWMRIAPDKLLHPNEKPIVLMRRLIVPVVPPGGVVLDPFMGSGPTGYAAVYEGRRFLGIELDSEYADIARRRIEHAAAQARQLELIP